LNPSQLEWRWKYALLLYDAEKFTEARREMREVLKVWPQNLENDDKLRATERLIEIR
jgi:hypothetical protein